MLLRTARKRYCLQKHITHDFITFIRNVKGKFNHSVALAKDGGYPGRTRTSNERIKISSVAITLPGNLAKVLKQVFATNNSILHASF